MLGTNALSQTVPEAAVQYLKDLSEDDGGWAWLPGLESGSDTNSTSLAVQALIANGEPLTASAVISGLNFLKSAQNPDGGFTYDPDSIYGTDSDTNSTAYAVQAIWAAGQDPLTGTWVISNTNPVSYLLSMQLEDGSFEWQSGFGSNLLATQQAIPALLGKAFPFQVSTLETCPGSMLYLPLIQH
jgi:prenyltransferase beta subunit